MKTFLAAIGGFIHEFLRKTIVFDTRVLALLIPALLVLSADMPVMMTLLYALSAIFVIVAVAIIIRRVLFHFIDMEEVEDQASSSPTGAGLVFLGVCLVTSSILITAAIWLSK